MSDSKFKTLCAFLIEGDLDSHCQGVIDEAEESSSDADKAHAQTLLKVLND